MYIPSTSKKKFLQLVTLGEEVCWIPEIPADSMTSVIISARVQVHNVLYVRFHGILIRV